MIFLEWLDEKGKGWAQKAVAEHHYLQSPVDARCSVEGYRVRITGWHGTYTAGLLLFGRPEATRCYPWYGSVEDVTKTGRAEVTRWQVLNLARVWVHPRVQPGGENYHAIGDLPGFLDRKGEFRSTLVSETLKLALNRIGFDYLIARPPCFLDEPYQIEWLLSYCDTRLHKGTIYKAAGFELYRTNRQGIQTWRKRLKPLTPEEDAAVCEASRLNRRSQTYRAAREYAGSQLAMGI